MKYSNYILKGSYSPRGGGKRIGKSEREKRGELLLGGQGKSSIGEHHYKGRMCPTSCAQANIALL